MAQYDDEPEELWKLFGDSLIPPEIQELLSGEWARMKPNERQQLLGKLRKERDKPRRMVIAAMEATRVLLS